MKNANISFNHSNLSMLNILSSGNYSQSSVDNTNGLELIKTLVDLMRGKINVQQELQKATTFTITIPNKNNFLIKDSSMRKESSFIQNVQSILAENLDNESFSILQLCKAIGISRSQLHNKIKKETGVSTSIFIRNIRLEKAKNLLKNTDLNISEVAYEVGFKDPSYFSRLFAEKYGVPPRKARIKKQYL